MNIIKAITAVLFLATAISSAAQSDYRLGYCDNTRKVGDKMMSGDTPAESYEAAIFLTAAQLSTVSGGEFTGVNIGLYTPSQVTGLTSWIRAELDGENLASGTASGIVKNWNAVKFAEPLPIEEGKGYYVGYTATIKPSTIVFLPLQYDTGVENSLFYRRGTGEWADRHDLGSLFAEALIRSDKLPQNELALTEAAFREEYCSEWSVVHLDFKVRNTGMADVTNFETVLTCADQNVSVSRKVDCDLKYDDRGEFSSEYTMSGLTPDRSHTFILTITKVNGADDEYEGNNSVTLDPIPFVQQLYDRSVLVEEFTTENCSNCPTAAANLKQAYNTLGEDEQARVAIVCHHSGFGTDNFTLSCDEQFLGFYMAGGRIYAPAFMLDRASVDGNGGTPVFKNPGAISLRQRIRNRMNVPSFVKISMTGSHDADNRTVTVKVEGKATKRPATPSIFVYVTEDNVKPALFQNGSTGDYRHQHLIRAYNADWGAEPLWNEDGTFTYSCTLRYPEGCVPANMDIVALMANVDQKSDFGNCAVENACKMKLKDATGDSPVSGVGMNEVGTDLITISEGTIFLGQEAAAEVYSVSGSRVDNGHLSPAVYLVKDHDGTFRKVVVR